MAQLLQTEADIETVFGKTPAPVKLKQIDFLDEGALQWIDAASVMIASFGDENAIGATLGGGIAFVAASSKEITVRKSALDHPELARPGAGFGSLFLVNSMTETMRVNGKVAEVHGDKIRVVVEECYGHCGKSLIRSDFWAASPTDGPADVSLHVAASRFMALATADAAACADLSPKGDPAGMMAQLHSGRVWFADRPGNRRVDSFRNLIARPRLAALLLVPGSTQVACVSGLARIRTDQAARARFTVQDKMPAVAIEIEDLTIDLHDSQALRTAELWPAKPPTQRFDPASLFLQHLRLNRDKGLAARMARAAFSIPGADGLIRKGLAKDYKDNLY